MGRNMEDNYLKLFGNMFYNIKEDQDNKKIIEEASEVLASIIIKYGELINEITARTSAQDEFVDTVICLFLRKIMEQLDALNILIDAGAFSPMQVIVRTLLENTVGLEFILKEDTRKRAAAYYLEQHYKEIETGEKLFARKSEKSKNAIKLLGEAQFTEDSKRFQRKKDAFQHLIDTNELFKEVADAREKAIESKRKYWKKKKRKNINKIHIQWYEIGTNVQNFREMMRETGHEKYYEGIYGGLSYEIHALNAARAIQAVADGLYLQRIRNPQNGGNIFAFVCDFSLIALDKVYKYLDDDEVKRAEFKRYVMDCQKKKVHIIATMDQINIL